MIKAVADEFFNRTIENNGLKETSAKLGKGIIAFSPLSQGMLTSLAKTMK